MGAEMQSALERRRRNQVWTGAGRYGYRPEFLADLLYMNLIIGLADRRYGGEWIQSLFDTWKGDRRQDGYDTLAWLILEQELYEAELPMRPALSELRREYADEYLGRAVLKSRQENLSADALSSAVAKAHWQTAAGRRISPLFPRERALLKEVDAFHAETPEQWREQFLDLLRRYYRFTGEITADGYRINLHRHLAALLRRILPRRFERRPDTLQFGRAGEAAGGSGSQGGFRLFATRAENDRQYVENCFGGSVMGVDALAAWERALCRDGHADCHLWLTDGRTSAEQRSSAESRHVAFEARAQRERNRAHYRENATLYTGAVRRLTEQIKNSLLLQSESAGLPSRRGVLDTCRVWRYPALRDDRVFLRREEEPQPVLSVELLLDASASRLNSQELIAAQGVILAESLRACGIPVQVHSFCSIRSYTVLRTLKSANSDDSRGIFGYFAAGWNRDALALSAAGSLLQDTPAEKRLLLILTDARPSDSVRYRPSGSFGIGKDYDGALAVDDTAKAVHDLRESGVRVAAIFMGSAQGARNAMQIYGQSGFVRVQSMEQLADGAGKLICREILA
jgi:hypothetical protein